MDFSGRMHNALVLSLSAYDSNVLSVIVRNLHHKAPVQEFITLFVHSISAYDSNVYVSESVQSSWCFMVQIAHYHAQYI